MANGAGRRKALRRYDSATRAPSDEDPADDLDLNNGDLTFVFDLEGDMDASTGAQRAAPKDPDAANINSTHGDLLLPEHVTITDDHGEQGEGSDDQRGDDDDELGHYDVLGGKGGDSRYYSDDEGEDPKVEDQCAQCMEKGHIKKNCPHILCVACGAFDEHQTRECPVSIMCHRCGLTGHISRACPNSRGPRGMECPRCYSTNHPEAACPTLWRRYRYLSTYDHERERALEAARQGRLQEDQGGRHDDSAGSVSGSDMDEGDGGDRRDYERTLPRPRRDWDPAQRWCYNCARKGNHWGDDCPQVRATMMRATGEPSAFSEWVSHMGPFARDLPPPPPDTSVGGLSSRDFTFGAGPHSNFGNVIDPDALMDGYFSRKNAGKGKGRDPGDRHAQQHNGRGPSSHDQPRRRQPSPPGLPPRAQQGNRRGRPGDWFENRRMQGSSRDIDTERSYEGPYGPGTSRRGDRDNGRILANGRQADFDRNDAITLSSDSDDEDSGSVREIHASEFAGQPANKKARKNKKKKDRGKRSGTPSQGSDSESTAEGAGAAAATESGILQSKSSERNRKKRHSKAVRVERERQREQARTSATATRSLSPISHRSLRERISGGFVRDDGGASLRLPFRIDTRRSRKGSADDKGGNVGIAGGGDDKSSGAGKRKRNKKAHKRNGMQQEAQGTVQQRGEPGFGPFSYDASDRRNRAAAAAASSGGKGTSAAPAPMYKGGYLD
ncbi:hypothetical protein K437DRAFT_268622 [Tilletiaria anomala UBC 951]|uniref:CCHC-type domain-containing protein n=1 Tax=Tilletiaria anomala (strain ATCC 24038 / CBS 436.72 / UBC 951) TaxID=1037660 RepID=A0A066VXA1_TILAU|nr:uncharacterized protein K437DRAFT_268622 [Tilletiaria anomala UBC 951]KDN44893.1 hypothetical protein K437DRAFT_268622 [Tilletiaria anomala UBC 951]